MTKLGTKRPRFFAFYIIAAVALAGTAISYGVPQAGCGGAVDEAALQQQLAAVEEAMCGPGAKLVNYDLVETTTYQSEQLGKTSSALRTTETQSAETRQLAAQTGFKTGFVIVGGNCQGGGTPALPTISNPSEQIDRQQVTITASIHPGSSPTTGVVYLFDTNPTVCDETLGRETPGRSLGAGASPVPYQEVIKGLAPEKTYYYCVTGSNALGVIATPVRSFTTPPPATNGAGDWRDVAVDEQEPGGGGQGFAYVCQYATTGLLLAKIDLANGAVTNLLNPNPSLPAKVQACTIDPGHDAASGFVYFVYGNKLARVPRTGGPREDLYSTCGYTETARSIAVDDYSVYVGYDRKLRRFWRDPSWYGGAACPPAVGPMTQHGELATLPVGESVRSIVPDVSGAVYFTTYGPRVLMLSSGQCDAYETACVPQTVAQLSTPTPATTGLAVTAATIFFTDYRVNLGDTGGIYRIARGAPVTTAPSYLGSAMKPWKIKVDPTGRIHWTNTRTPGQGSGQPQHVGGLFRHVGCDKQRIRLERRGQQQTVDLNDDDGDGGARGLALGHEKVFWVAEKTREGNQTHTEGVREVTGIPQTTWTAPNLLSETGLYRNIAQGLLRQPVKRYAPQHVLWSDNADKERFFRLPDSVLDGHDHGGDEPGFCGIDTSNKEHWSFPIGTRVWKQFTRDNVRVETRLIARTGEETYVFASYLWNAARTEATLVSSSGMPNALGTQHDIPSHDQCVTCHSSNEKYLSISGVQTKGTDQSGWLTTAWLNQIRADGLRYVSHPVTAYTPPPCSTGGACNTTNQRFGLGYLHANCGHCHNEDTDQALNLRLRTTDATFQQTSFYSTALNAPSGRQDYPYFFHGGAGSSYTPGAPPPAPPSNGVYNGQAYAFYRMAVRDGEDGVNPNTQMPKIGTEDVHAAALSTLIGWVTSLPP